ncbi:hypothetical protein b3_0363 [Synechococcus phage B3]|nr:hypothetical protein b3_0363 [Synechococcus phage B3]QGT54963.1 hypothetical protein b23_0357 [Synechococcus phage B23]
MSDITLVTALYDINRDIYGDGRTFEEYLVWFSKTLKITTPMVIYVDESLVDFVKKERGSLPTKIITQSLEEVPYYSLNESINNILMSDNYRLKIDAPDRIECKMSMYNVIIYSKFKWVELAVKNNYFNSQYFMWVDAGLSRFFGGIDNNYPSKNATETLIGCADHILIQTSMSYYPDLVEAEGCSGKYFWDSRSWVMAGLWGGGNKIMLEFCNEIENILTQKMIKNNVVNNEQIAMAYLYKNKPNMFIEFENYAHIHRQYELIQELGK